MSPHKKSIGWAVGAEVTSRRYYGRRKPNCFFRGQDGRVVKAGALGGAHVKLWDRTWSSPDSKKVHIGRCVGFNHVRNSIWQA